MRLITLRKVLLVGALLFCISIVTNAHCFSKKFVIGGGFGLSLGDGTAGLQIGPTGAYYFNRNMD